MSARTREDRSLAVDRRRGETARTVTGDVDELMSVVRSAERRRVLDALEDGDTAVVESLAATVAAGPSEQRNVAIRLRHVHLPKLEDAGLITWDRDAGIVRPGPRYNRVRPLLDTVRSDYESPP